MNQSYLFYYFGSGLIVILLLGITYYALRLNKKKQQKRLESSDYVKALNYLIDGNLSRAIEYFYNSVRNDTENIDAYLKLGDIFRQQKKVDKAIKIHRELLVRRNLSLSANAEITQSLVLDYFSIGQYSQALDSLNSIFAVDPKNIWAQTQQLAIHEAEGDWEDAFKSLKSLARLENIKNVDDQLSLYKVEQAGQKFKDKNEKEGRILLREALKIDPKCSSAHIELGDSYAREERHTDAIKVWVEFVRNVPKHSYLVFDRLQEVLYSIGSYSEIENILRTLHEEHPENRDIIFTLSDIRVRKGDIESAIDLCESILDRTPDSMNAKMRLVKLYDRKDEKEKALKTALDLADQSTDSVRTFLCSKCNYHSQIPLWRCPECKSWKSFNI